MLPHSNFALPTRTTGPFALFKWTDHVESCSHSRRKQLFWGSFFTLGSARCRVIHLDLLSVRNTGEVLCWQ